MKQLIIIIFAFTIVINSAAQGKKYIGLSFFNTQPSMPFGKFSGMFKDALHPGIELMYGKNFSVQKKHDWFYEYRAGYFFHRYVQHGLPVYANLGYRYHFSPAFTAETGIGAGLMFSIPAVGVFEQSSEVGYKKKKGKIREQLIATYGIGFGFCPDTKTTKQWRIFANYQQRIQFPFVKSYVPFLPYNSFMIGISRAIGKNNKQSRKEKRMMGPLERLLIQKPSYSTKD